jgi:hypothetical protein
MNSDLMLDVLICLRYADLHSKHLPWFDKLQWLRHVFREEFTAVKKLQCDRAGANSFLKIINHAGQQQEQVDGEDQ